MELIFYSEAAKILGVSEGILRQAVARGELTRAGMVGNRQRLIKEQVMLYMGVNPRTGRKKQLRFESLSSEEQALWQQYTDELKMEQSKAMLPNDIEKIVRKIANEEYERNAAREEWEYLREKQERLEKRFPFLKREELQTA